MLYYRKHRYEKYIKTEGGPPVTREEYILSEIKARYKSLREFSKVAGIPNSTLSSMFKKGIGGTAVDTVFLVCSKLGIDPGKLSESASPLPLSGLVTAEERALLAQYRKLDAYSQSVIKLLIEKEAGRPVSAPEVKEELRPIRLFDLPASAGTGQFLDGEGYEEVLVSDAVSTEAAFGIRIQGDSMEPKIPNGNAVWVRPQPMLQDGEVGIFLLNGQGYCKKLRYQAGKYQLCSLNTKYPPIPISEFDELRVIGKVLSTSPITR